MATIYRNEVCPTCGTCKGSGLTPEQHDLIVQASQESKLEYERAIKVDAEQRLRTRRFFIAYLCFVLLVGLGVLVWAFLKYHR